MNAFLPQPQDSPAQTELLLPPPQLYLVQRCLTAELALSCGIFAEHPSLTPQRIRFVPKEFERVTHALSLRCRDFDGTYHESADQVILFGKFTDPETRNPLDRLRLSALGIPNRISWYGNTVNPKLVVYCESRIKALVTSQAHPDWLCAGMNGVDGWSAGKDKEDVVIPAANLIPPIDTRALPAVLLPDSHHHKQVRRAMAALTTVLRPHYASVALAKLPPPPDDRPDWGADDYAAFCGGPHALRLVVPAAVPEQALFPISAAPAIALRNPPLWVVKDVIPTDEITLIVGPTSCGKTFVTMDLLLALAGTPTHWLGKPIRVHGPTVHVSLETRSLPLRLRAYAQHHNTPLPAGYHAIEANVTLPTDLQKLIQSLAGIQPVAIAIDTVNRALGGGDENSSADMGAFIRAAEELRLAFPGCAVLLVHHLGKDATKGARGHSSLTAAVGAELQVDHDKETGVRSVKLGKLRDGSTDFCHHFTLAIQELGRDGDNEPITSCVVQPCAPPAADADADSRTRYQWIYLWYCGDQNNARPLSKRRVGENLANIRPKNVKVTRADLEAAFLWAADKGYAVLADTQPKKGEWFDLRPLPEPKY